MRTTIATDRPSLRSSTLTLAFAATLLTLLSTPFAAAADPGGSEGAAAELRREAREMVQDNRGYAEAAEHLVRTSGRLEASTAGRGANLRLASRMYHYAGLEGKAYRTMLDAGTALYRAGQGLEASRAFLDAAELAVEMDRDARAWKAANMAGSIVHDADITEEERRELLDRVQYRTTTRIG